MRYLRVKLPRIGICSAVISLAGVLLSLTLSLPAMAAGPIGVNVAMPEFVDAMKSATEFRPVTNGATVTLDAQGWPTGDVQFCVLDNRVNMPWNGPDPDAVPIDDSGTYHMSFLGQATIVAGEDAFTVANQRYSAKTNLTTVELQVPKGHNLIVISLKDVHGGVRDIRIIRPGYAPDTKEMFTRRYLKGLAPFDTLRFMDSLSTNNWSRPGQGGAYPKMSEWKDRRLPTDPTQSDSATRKGIAWEYVIALANTTKKNAWINIPVAATDDEVTQIARLFKDQLNPKLKLYVEYSNEVWNWGFVQSWWNNVASQKESAAANQPGGDPRNKGLTYDLRYARRTAEIAAIFQQVFGKEAMISRVRPVLVWQCGFTGQEMLTYLKKNFGEPRQYIYAIGCAPYLTSTDYSSVDNILQGLMKSADSYRGMFATLKATAISFGVQTITYEGGVGIDGAAQLATKLKTQRDPRVADVVKHELLDTWFANGGGLFCYYSYAGAWGPYGSWGLLDNTFNPSSPKYQGMLAVIKAPQPEVTVGQLLPSTLKTPLKISQSSFIGNNRRTGEFIFTANVAEGGQIFPFLFRATSDGTYTMTADGGWEGAAVGFELDGSTLAEHTLPYSLTFSLKKGLHALRFISKGKLRFGGDQNLVITKIQ